MNISYLKLKNLSQSMQNVIFTQVSINNSVIIVLKSLFRSDDVIMDIYVNDISENTKIIAGKKLTPDCLISLPNRSVNFPFYIYCIDKDGINESINRYNVSKFYLQFVNKDDGNIWTIEDFAGI